MGPKRLNRKSDDGSVFYTMAFVTYVFIGCFSFFDCLFA